MPFANHVSLPRDLSLNLDVSPVFATGHQYLSGTTGATSPMIPHLEFVAPMLWPPGFVLGKNKFTHTVFHNGLWIALEGHDLGNALAHFPNMPDCVLTPMHILLSSRKSKFYSAEVKANGKGIAACTVIDIGIIPTPMVPCSVLPLPVGGSITSVLFNTLIVGMNGWQLLACWVEVIVAIIVAVLKLGGASSTASGNVSEQFGEYLKDMAKMELFNKGEIVSSALGAIVRRVGQLNGDFHGDANFTVGVVNGPAGFQMSVGRSGEDDRLTGGMGWRMGSEDMGPNVHGGVTVQGGGVHDAPVQSEGSVGVSPLPGSSGDLRYSTNRPESVRGPGDPDAGFYGHTETPLGESDFTGDRGHVFEGMPDFVSGDPTRGMFDHVPEL